MKGKPSVLIYEGKIVIDEMKKIRFNRDDLMEELRQAGYANIGDVRYGILETNGRLSVIPQKNKEPLVQKDIPGIVQAQQQMIQNQQKQEKKELQNQKKKKNRLIKKQAQNKAKK